MEGIKPKGDIPSENKFTKIKKRKEMEQKQISNT
jgi:hypothetical protein